MSFQNRISRSAEIFENLIYPLIKEIINGGNLIKVETENNAFLRTLDITAGIDYFYEIKNGGFRSIAARVEDKGRNYQTFTIRIPHEYEGRLRDLADGNLAPDWWVHAYTDGEEFQSAAVIKTKELFRALHRLKGEGRLVTRTNPQDGNKFYSIPFSETAAIVISALQ